MSTTPLPLDKAKVLELYKAWEKTPTPPKKSFDSFYEKMQNDEAYRVTAFKFLHETKDKHGMPITPDITEFVEALKKKELGGGKPSGSLSPLQSNEDSGVTGGTLGQVGSTAEARRRGAVLPLAPLEDRAAKLREAGVDLEAKQIEIEKARKALDGTTDKAKVAEFNKLVLGYNEQAAALQQGVRAFEDDAKKEVGKPVMPQFGGGFQQVMQAAKPFEKPVVAPRDLGFWENVWNGMQNSNDDLWSFMGKAAVRAGQAAMGQPIGAQEAAADMAEFQIRRYYPGNRSEKAMADMGMLEAGFAGFAKSIPVMAGAMIPGIGTQATLGRTGVAIVSSVAPFVSGYESAMKTAEEAGVQGADKYNYAALGGLFEALSERILPDYELAKPLLKKGLTDIIKRGAKGMTAKGFATEMLDVLAKGGLEVAEEALVEFSTAVTDFAYSYGKGYEALTPEAKSAKEYGSIALAALMGAGVVAGTGSVYNTATARKSAIAAASSNPGLTEQVLADLVESQQITEVQAQKFMAEVNSVANARAKMPSGLDGEQMVDSAPLIERKQAIDTELEALNLEKQSVDDAFKSVVDEKIKALQDERGELDARLKEIATTKGVLDDMTSANQDAILSAVRTMEDDDTRKFRFAAIEDVPEAFRDRAKKTTATKGANIGYGKGIKGLFNSLLGINGVVSEVSGSEFFEIEVSGKELREIANARQKEITSEVMGENQEPQAETKPAATPAEKAEPQPIGELGTGANIYFESEKYRVNDNTKDGGVNIVIGDANDVMPLKTLRLEDKGLAVFIAENLEAKMPKGLTQGYHDVDAIVADLTKQYNESQQQGASGEARQQPAEPKTEETPEPIGAKRMAAMQALDQQREALEALKAEMQTAVENKDLRAQLDLRGRIATAEQELGAAEAQALPLSAEDSAVLTAALEAAADELGVGLDSEVIELLAETEMTTALDAAIKKGEPLTPEGLRAAAITAVETMVPEDMRTPKAAKRPQTTSKEAAKKDEKEPVSKPEEKPLEPAVEQGEAQAEAEPEKPSIEAWRQEFEAAKQSGSRDEMQAFYDKLNAVLNGIAQKQGDEVVAEFQALKAEVEAEAKAMEASESQPESKPEPQAPANLDTDRYPVAGQHESHPEFIKIKERYEGATKFYGREQSHTKPDGTKIRVRPVLISAYDITPTHNPRTFAMTPGVPVNTEGKTINDRDYTIDTQAQAVVDEMGADYDGRALQNPPFQDAAGVVKSGTNTTMSRIIAHEGGADSKYLEDLPEKLEQMGIDPANISAVQAPTLTYEIIGESPYTTAEYRSFNIPTTKDKSPVQEAIGMAKSLTDDQTKTLIRMLDQTEVETKQQKAYVGKQIRKFMLDSGLLTERALPRYFDKEGALNTSGQELMENLILATVLNEDQMVMINEEGNKRYRQPLAKLKFELLANAGLPEAFQVMPDILVALELSRQINAEKTDFVQYVGQTKIGDKVNPSREQAILYFALQPYQGGIDNLRDFMAAVNAAGSPGAQQAQSLFASEEISGEQRMASAYNTLFGNMANPVEREGKKPGKVAITTSEALVINGIGNQHWKEVSKAWKKIGDQNLGFTPPPFTPFDFSKEGRFVKAVIKAIATELQRAKMTFMDFIRNHGLTNHPFWQQAFNAVLAGKKWLLGSRAMNDTSKTLTPSAVADFAADIRMALDASESLDALKVNLGIVETMYAAKISEAESRKALAITADMLAAVNNSADLSAAQEAINDILADATADTLQNFTLTPRQDTKPKALGKALGDAVTSFHQQFSKYEWLRKIERELREANDMPMAPGEVSLATTFETGLGVNARAESDLLDFKNNVLGDIISQDLVPEFEQYLFWMRVKDRLTTDANKRGVGKYTKADAENNLRKLEKDLGADKWGTLVASGERFQQHFDELLQRSVDAELINQETYDAIKAANEFYVGFQLITEDGDILDPREQPMQGSVIKKIKGIKQEDADFRLQNILETAGAIVYRARKQQDHNRRMAKMYRTLLDIDPEGLTFKKVRLTQVAEDPDTGQKIVKFVNPKPDPGTGIIYFKIDGKPRALQVPYNVATPFAFSAAGRTEGLVLRLLNIGQYLLKQGATALNASFLPINLMLDASRLATMSKYGIQRIPSTPFVNPFDLAAFTLDIAYGFTTAMLGSNFNKYPQFFDAVLNSPVIGKYMQQIAADYQEFAKTESAGYTFTSLNNPEAFRQRLNFKPRDPGAWTSANTLTKSLYDLALTSIINPFEQTGKIAATRRAKRLEGVDSLQELEATDPVEYQRIISEIVKSGSPNFLKSGEASRWANGFMPYFMARLNVLTDDLQRLAGRPGAGGGAMAAEVYTRLINLVAVPTAMIAIYQIAMGFDTEDEESPYYVPDYVRNNNFVLHTDRMYLDSKGQPRFAYMKIPAQGPIKWVKNGTEAAIWAVHNEAPVFVTQWARATIEDFLPLSIGGKDLTERSESFVSSLNPLLKIPLELTFNRDTFRKQTIVPNSFAFSQLPDYMKYDESVPDVYVWAAEKLAEKKIVDVSPHMLEQAAKSFTADLFTQFVPPKPDGDIPMAMKYPVLRRLYGVTPSEDSKKMERLQPFLEQLAVEKKGLEVRAAVQIEARNKMSPEEKMAYDIKLHASDPELYKTMIDILKKEARPDLSYIEKRYLGVNMANRAQAMWIGDFKAIRDNEALFEARLKELMEKRVATQSHAEKLREYRKGLFDEVEGD